MTQNTRKRNKYRLFRVGDHTQKSRVRQKTMTITRPHGFRNQLKIKAYWRKDIRTIFPHEMREVSYKA